MKRITVIIVFLILACSLLLTSSAHNTGQSGTIIWGESVGWGINEGFHTNSMTLTYRVNPAMAQNYKNMVSGGANLWNQQTPFTVSETSNGTGYITTRNINATVNALFWSYSKISL